MSRRGDPRPRLMAVTFVFRKKGKRTESGLSASFTLISNGGLEMDPRVREDDVADSSFLRRACPRPDRGQESIPVLPAGPKMDPRVREDDGAMR